MKLVVRRNVADRLSVLGTEGVERRAGLKPRPEAKPAFEQREAKCDWTCARFVN